MTNEVITPRKAMRLYCAQHDTTQTQVAFELGIDQGWFSKLVNGVVPATDEQADKILEKTGIDVRQQHAEEANA